MADNTQLNEGSGGDLIATDDISGVKHQMVKVEFGANGTATPVSTADPLPVQILGTPSLATDASTASNQDEQSALLSDMVNQQATDAKLELVRLLLSSLDTKNPALGQALAAASVPVVLPLTQIATLTPPAAITGFLTETDFDSKVGSLTESAPASDTASSGLNGRLQRIAQRISSFIGLLPTSIGQKTKANSLAVTLASDSDVLPVSTPAPITVANNKVTVTTAGTRVALAASTTIKSVTVKASVSNAGIVYVGNATVAASNGFELAAGDSVSLDISDLATVFVDASINSQIVTFIAVN